MLDKRVPTELRKPA